MKSNLLCLITYMFVLVSMAHADDATEHGSLVARDWKPSTQVASDHVPWMKPSIHGSMHVLVVQPWQNLREVVELHERMEMTFDVIPVTSVGRNSIQTKGMFDYEREDFEAKLPHADVLVMCGMPPQWLDVELWQKMLARVEQGMGLVWTMAVPEHERLTDLLSGATRTPSYLLHGAPYALLDRVDPYSAFRCTTRGKGRIAAWIAPNMFRYGWTTMTPVTPLAANEIHYGIITRLVIWASNKNTPAKVLLPQQVIELPAAKAAQVKLVINADKSITNAELIWTIRDASTLWDSYKPVGPMHTLQWPRQVGRGNLDVVKQFNQPVNLIAGANDLQLDLPALPHGPYALDARLIDLNLRAIDWDATTLQIKNETSIRWITLPVNGIAPTTESYADVRFELPNDKSQELQLAWDVKDSYGRMLAQGSAPWNGKPHQRISFIPHHALAKGIVLRVRLLDGSSVVSTRQVTGLMTLERDKPFRYGVYEPLLARLKDLETDTLVTSHANWMEEAELAMNNLDAFFWLNGPSLYNDSKNPELRTPCFNDPDFREEYKNYLASISPMLKRQRAIGGLIADEWDFPWNHNEHYGTRRAGKPGPLNNLCQCGYCLTKFHLWLQSDFNNDLTELNEAWGTRFDAWDAVTMPKIADVGKSMNHASTASRLRFNDFTTADFFSYVNAQAERHAPSIRLGLSGTRPSDGLNGYDYWQLSQQGARSFVHYGGPMTAQTLDFRKDPKSVFVSKWEGYSIWNSSNAGAVMWRAFIQGQDGLIQYAAYPAYGTHQIDWTLGAGTEAMGKAFKEIDSGLSVLISNSSRRKSPIAIHYSPGSYALAAAGVIPKVNGTQMAKQMEEVHQLLIDCGFDPIFISTSRIEKGALATEGCKLLILPDSFSLSDLEVHQIAQFREAGGKVLATSPAGIYNIHGRKRTDPPSYQPLKNINYQHTKQDGLGGEIDVVSGTKQDYKISRDVMTRQLAQHEITPPVSIQGQHRLASQIVTHVQNNATYFMIWPGPFVHDDIKNRTREQVNLTLPGIGELYDVRSRKHLRQLTPSNSITQTLEEGEPLIYAILPYKVASLKLDVRTPSVAPGHKVTVKATLVTNVTQQPADHVIEISIKAPDGTLKTFYASSQIIKNGSSEWTIPLALNDTAGQWTVLAQDVVSGVTQKAHFVIE